MKKSIPTIWEREGNEKKNSHNSGMGIRGILGNGREREIPLTPGEMEIPGFHLIPPIVPSVVMISRITFLYNSHVSNVVYK